MPKMLFSDLDGTLLNSEKKVSEKDAAAIREMTRKGNYFVINTGRPTQASLPFATELGLNTRGCYLVSYNGGVITEISNNHELYDVRLDYGTVEELFMLAEQENLYIQTYDGNAIVYSRDGKELFQYSAGKAMSEVYAAGDVISHLHNEPHKCIVISYTDHDALENFRRKYMGRFDSRCDMFFSCPEFLEIMPKGIDKGGAVRQLSGFLRIPVEDTIAVGDERNDIPMIKAAGIGIAMANSHPDVKLSSDYVTSNDCDHNAIAEIIEKYIL